MICHPSFHAHATPDKVAYLMATSGAKITYAELERASNQGAQLFRALSVKPQDHIALLSENSIRFMEICWAAQRCGVYYTTISTHLTPGEVAYIVQDCGAQVFISTADLAEFANQAAGQLPDGVKRYMSGPAVSGWRSWDAAVAAMPATRVTDEIAGYDMLYSSGTTGRPKGVKPAFKNEPLGTPPPLLDLLYRKMCGMEADSVYLSPAPLYHAAPLRFNMTIGVLGATSVIMEKFDAEEFLQLVEQHYVTQTQVVPTMFVRLLKLPPEVRRKYNLSSLKAAVHAAAPCPIEIKRQMIDWWGPILVDFYSSTERNGATACDSREWLAHPGTVGRALGVNVKILGDDGEEVPAGEIGHVYFTEGFPFSYHNDPVKTKAAYNDKGWSGLGDIGYVDREGYLYLTDRSVNMIISGGVNIYPQEVEDLLVLHPAVADVAVFGVPSEEMGEELKAIVQPIDMARAGPGLAAELIEFCRGRLSHIKCPRTIDFRAELPRTPTGKLLKRSLRDRYWKKPA
jgi:long-chain acyl-CoA synthetase